MCVCEFLVSMAAYGLVRSLDYSGPAPPGPRQPVHPARAPRGSGEGR